MRNSKEHLSFLASQATDFLFDPEEITSLMYHSQPGNHKIEMLVKVPRSMNK